MKAQPASAGTTAASAAPVVQAAAPRAALGAAARNMLWLSVDKAVAVVLGLVVFGLIARELGPQGAGQFSYAVAVLQTTLGLSLVCSSAAVMPRLCRLADGPASRAVGNVFVARMLGAVLAAAVAAAYVVLAVDDPQRRLITLVMLAAVPLIEPFHAFGAYWQSRNNNRPLFVARGGGLVARLVMVLAALWLGAAVWIIALAWVLEAAIAALLQMRGISAVQSWSRILHSISRQRTGTYLRFGVRFMAGLLLSHLFLRMDRLWLAEHMNAHDFGLYATAMQLVEVWLNVAFLISGSIAPAFLYRALQRSGRVRSHWRVVAGLAALGVAGAMGAWLLGPWILVTVFGADFAGSHAYLVAGFSVAVLFFMDQVVQIAITARNRPALLALKWAVACASAAAVLLLFTGELGAFAGPAGMAGGLCAGWITVALVGERALNGRPQRRRDGDPADAPAGGDPGPAATRPPPPSPPPQRLTAATLFPTPREDSMLVSVIINSYNYGRYIGAAIDSALAQTWRPLEVIVVDDGSTDDSWSIIEGYGDRIAARRQPNAGQGSAYNAGFEMSRGEWVLFLDSDDMLDPHAVARCMAAARDDTAKVQFRLRTIGPDGEPRGGTIPYLMHDGDVTEIVRRFGVYAGPPSGGNMYRRSAIARYLPMPAPSWRRAADTVPFVLSALHGKVVTITEPLGSYRLHSPHSRGGLFGNVSRSMREAVSQPGRARVALLAWAAQRSDFRFNEPIMTMPSDWRLRALAWRLNRDEYPFDDTRRSIWRGAMASLRQLPGYTRAERAMQMAWLAFVLLAPRAWVQLAASTNVSSGLRSRLKMLRGAGTA